MSACAPRQPIFAPKTRDDLFPITRIKPVRLHPELESQLPEQRNPFKLAPMGLDPAMTENRKLEDMERPPTSNAK
jgi:hypothetical protein